MLDILRPARHGTEAKVNRNYIARRTPDMAKLIRGVSNALDIKEDYRLITRRVITRAEHNVTIKRVVTSYSCNTGTGHCWHYVTRFAVKISGARHKL